MKIISFVAAIVNEKKKRLVCVGLCLMMGIITVSAQVKLSLNPEVGKKYEYHMETLQNIKQNVMGQEIPVETEMSGTYLMEIKNKTSQEIHVQLTYLDITFIVTNPMMNIRYDSKKPNENPSEMDKTFEKMFKALINSPFIVVFEPGGSVKSVTGMDVIIEKMIAAVSADGQIAAQMGAQMSQQFSGESMKNMFGQVFNFYPENAVKIGDSWNVENTMLMNNINLGIKSKNTLKGINANKATIEVAGDIDMDMEGGKLSGKQTGTMIVDTVTGMPATTELSQNMKGSIKAQGMDIQMEMTSKTKTSAKVIN